MPEIDSIILISAHLTGATVKSMSAGDLVLTFGFLPSFFLPSADSRTLFVAAD